MEKNRTKLSLLGLAVTALILGACGKTANVAEKPSGMVIVHTSGTASVTQAGVKSAAKIGLVVREQDEIATATGTVDLQTRGGSSIRVKENTTITVARLLGDQDTRIALKQGNLMASVKKSRADEEFAIVTPTAIAGVRGTTFTVEVGPDGKEPRVKVIDGKVAMAPRITALEQYDSAAIDADADLSRLATIQNQNEVIIEPSTVGSLDRVVENQVVALNSAMEAGAQENRPAKEVVRTEEVQKITAQLSQAPVAVMKAESAITVTETAEKATLVAVDKTVVEKVVAGQTEPAVVQELQSQREERREAAVASLPPAAAAVAAIPDGMTIQKEAEAARIQQEAAQRQLANQAAIRQYYQKLETLVMTDGSMHRGAVIAQTEDELVVHTPQGVIRLAKSEVDSIEFQ